MHEARGRNTGRRINAPRAETPRKKHADQPSHVNPDLLGAGRMIVGFMKISARVEQYLQRKGPLTDVQYDSIVTTIEGLRTFLLTWRTHFRKVK